MDKNTEYAAHKATVLRLHSIWSSGDVSAIPQVYHPDFIGHWPKGWQLGACQGYAGAEKALNRIRCAFPDWHEHIDDLICDGDKVVSRYQSTGTHLGDFAGKKPTQKCIEVSEISIYRLHHGKVIEQWCLADDLHLGKQLGLRL